MAANLPPNDGLKRSLGRALEQQRGRRRKPKTTARAPRLENPSKVMVDQLVTPEARKQGDYRVVDFKLDNGKEGADRKEKAKSIRVVRNVGGSAIERWYAKGGLDERQMQAVLFYQNAHRTAFGSEPRVTANYSPVIIRGLRSSVELYAGSVMAAKESLRLLDSEVFFREPVDHFQVWQNVVIFDKPAGVAAACAGFVVKKSAEAAAKVIVGGIAHKIANIVIDQSRRDFGDLILDLDAPRKPRVRP